MLTCEHECNGRMEKPEDSHSMWAVLQKVDMNGYNFFQCEEGQEHNFVNYQHFHCCHKHMQAGMVTCLNEHYGEEKLHPIPSGQGTTILHRIVLGGGLSCKVCGSLLTSVAYRFCLTQGLPQIRVPDQGLEHFGEWCCSFEHAKQSALAIIASMEVFK